MLADSISKADVAIYLGIYASVVSTAAGLWALFAGIFRDRARITVKTNEAYRVSTSKGPMIVKGEDTLATMGVQAGQATPILHVVVRNRGRRQARIENVSKMRWAGAWIFGELAGRIPFDLSPETSEGLVLGEDPELGRRWGFYVVDGAGRVHPLRYRYLRRLTFILYRWAFVVYWERKRRGMRSRR
ncbi:hypothetical protein AYO48_03660 [Gaiella sp. SCGC AG-212-M14]|nr:hypothetical protein AYO48_03660 [Gaiella sp. SCGC AG-212-M14]